MPVTCETLALRALYGHPRYVFPPREQLLEKVSAFEEKTLGQGKTPVLVAAALGEAQDVVRYLGGRHVLRFAPDRLSRLRGLRRAGRSLAGLRPPGRRKGMWWWFHPPRACRAWASASAASARFRAGRWTASPPPTRRCSLLADHAGFEDFLDCAVRSGTHRVYTINRYAEELARQLRNRGIDATAIRQQHQLPLPGV